MSASRLGFGAIAIFCALSSAAAQPPQEGHVPTTRFRGTVVSIKGDVLVIRTAERRLDEILLTPETAYGYPKGLSLNDIGPNSFIGTATKSESDGSLSALEVVIFPENKRGRGEGERRWDLKRGSLMINGTVSDIVPTGKGNDMQIQYHGASKRLHVQKNVPVVSLELGSRSDLKVGAKIFGEAIVTSADIVVANYVLTGKNGVNPPM